MVSISGHKECKQWSRLGFQYPAWLYSEELLTLFFVRTMRKFLSWAIPVNTEFQRSCTKCRVAFAKTFTNTLDRWKRRSSCGRLEREQQQRRRIIKWDENQDKRSAIWRKCFDACAIKISLSYSIYYPEFIPIIEILLPIYVLPASSKCWALAKSGKEWWGFSHSQQARGSSSCNEARGSLAVSMHY